MSMCATRFTSFLCFAVSLSLAASAESPHVLPPDELPRDKRLERLTELSKDYFGFTLPSNPEAWSDRADRLRRQVLIACGLWPMPTRSQAHAVVHGKIDRDDYTVEKVYLESFPGHFVTGNLYRPKHFEGRRPAVLCPHGHWPDGRFLDQGAEKIRQELIEGRERFEVGGRYPLQARCVQLARMGCVVFHYDMVGYADSVQLGHRDGLRPAMDTPENWGYFSVQAELRLQSTMGLQTYNSICALDWISSLADVDRRRIGVTGGSGGGTQTFILAAVDSRPAVVFPAVMVSTGMQGGCSCENACYLRVGTGNVELAGLTAPRPLGMTGANDWTREIMTKGLPELKTLYKMLGVEDQVMARAFLQFPHNYNYVSRAVMYHWFNQHLKLGLEEPIVEEDFLPLSRDELTVWNQRHPKPEGGEEYERALLRWITQDSDRTMAALVPNDATSLAEYRKIVGGAWDILIGRRLPEPGAVIATQRQDKDQGTWTLSTFLLNHEPQRENVPAAMLMPSEWNKRIVIWVDSRGKQGLFTAHGTPQPSIRELLASGSAVLGLDLLGQGEFTTDDQPLAEQRLQPVEAKQRENHTEALWQKSAAFTFGYNYPLFSKRVHDVLSAIAFAKSLASDQVRIDLVGLKGAGHWVAAARAQAGAAVERTAIDTDGFRFSSVATFEDTNFVPGAAKYLDLPGVVSLSAPGKLWLAGEGVEPSVVRQVYRAAGSVDNLTTIAGDLADQEMATVRWLLP